MTISVRLSEEDTKLIKAYSDMNNISLSDLIRNAVLEKIEDEYDLKSYNKAIKEGREKQTFSSASLPHRRYFHSFHNLPQYLFPALSFHCGCF